jgi:hypothetical protein
MLCNRFDELDVGACGPRAQAEGGYHVCAPDLPGIHTQGDTLDEATKSRARDESADHVRAWRTRASSVVRLKGLNGTHKIGEEEVGVVVRPFLAAEQRLGRGRKSAQDTCCVWTRFPE